MKLILEWRIKDHPHSQTITDDQSIVIGRQPDCDIVLADPRVSRQHALISFKDNNFHLHNLSETNPIFFKNGELQLAYNKTLALKSGFNFQLGFVKLQVKSVRKMSTEQVAQLGGQRTVKCSNCQKRVDFKLKDCPWCGASSAHGLTVY